MLDARISQARRVLLWLALVALAALVTYVGFRAYFSPDLLFGFSNAFSC